MMSMFFLCLPLAAPSIKFLDVTVNDLMDRRYTSFGHFAMAGISLIDNGSVFGIPSSLHLTANPQPTELSAYSAISSL